MQEYAADIVSALMEICEEKELPHPHIISESGRALVAYHSILVFNVLGSSELIDEGVPRRASRRTPASRCAAMVEILKELSVKNFQESYHDAMQIRDETLTLFNVGHVSLEHRALVERLFWLVCQRIAKIVHTLDYVPDEFENLDRFISDTYYGNFSVFQSLPDHWAVKQLFPIMPIHRLNERPTRKATLADITCDSRRQDRPVHRPARREDHHRPARASTSAGPTTWASSWWAPTRRSWATCTTSSGTPTRVHVSITGQGQVPHRQDRRGRLGARRAVLHAVPEARRHGPLSAGRWRTASRRAHHPQESARIQKFLEEGLEGYTYLE